MLWDFPCVFPGFHTQQTRGSPLFAAWTGKADPENAVPWITFAQFL